MEIRRLGISELEDLLDPSNKKKIDNKSISISISSILRPPNEAVRFESKWGVSSRSGTIGRTFPTCPFL